VGELNSLAFGPKHSSSINTITITPTIKHYVFAIPKSIKI